MIIFRVVRESSSKKKRMIESLEDKTLNNTCSKNVLGNLLVDMMRVTEAALVVQLGLQNI